MNEQPSNLMTVSEEKAENMKRFLCNIIDRELWLEQNLNDAEQEISRINGMLRAEREWRRVAEENAAASQEEVERLKKELTIMISHADDLEDAGRRFKGMSHAVRLRLQNGDDVSAQMGPQFRELLNEIQRSPLMKEPKPQAREPVPQEPQASA